MKISIQDEIFDTLRTLLCFAKLADHDVIVWKEHLQDMDGLAERLAETEALVLICERTHISQPLLDRLSNLKLISQRSNYPHVDMDLCTEAGGILSSSQHPGLPSCAADELTWGLIIAAMRDISGQMAAPRAGNWQTRVGRPGMAAVDVYEDEPVLDTDHPRMSLPNVVCTPHIGYVTDNEFEVQFGEIFDQILAFEAGAPINVINPKALEA